MQLIINDNCTYLEFQQTIDAWKWIFLLTTGAYILAATQYAFLASGEVQWWNTYWERDTKNNKMGEVNEGLEEEKSK